MTSTYRKSMRSAISDASTAIDVWEFFPNTSTNTLNSNERVCGIFRKLKGKTLNTKILVTYIRVPINYLKCTHSKLKRRPWSMARNDQISMDYDKILMIYPYRCRYGINNFGQNKGIPSLKNKNQQDWALTCWALVSLVVTSY